MSTTMIQAKTQDRASACASRRAGRAAVSAAAATPDAVVASAEVAPFDSDDYKALCSRYLLPRVRENEELPDGTILRRQIGQTIIDQTPYATLKQRITDLKRSGKDEEIYLLLCELRQWEIRGGRVPDFLDESEASEVIELIDIAATEESEAIDVEAKGDSTTSTAVIVTSDKVQLNSRTPMSHHLQPLPDPVSSVLKASVVRTEQQQGVAEGDHRPEGETHEVIDLLCNSDEDNDMKIKHWTKKDDDVLINLVANVIKGSDGNRSIDWASIANQVGPGRSQLQCFERYSKLSKITNKTRGRKRQASMPLPDLPTLQRPQMQDTPRSTSRRGMVVPTHEEASSASSVPSPLPDTFIDVAGTSESHTCTRSGASLGTADSSSAVRAALGPSDHDMPITSPEEKVKRNVASTVADDDQTSLKAAWNRQTNLRTKGQWKPSGGWKPPAWAVGKNLAASAKKTKKQGTEQKPTKRRKIGTHASCSKQVLNRSLSLLADSIPRGLTVPTEVTNLSQLKCTGYVKKITEDLLLKAHRAQQRLLPATDCDAWEVVKMARSYYDFWRPAKGDIKAILLAESHSKTEMDQMTSIRLDSSLCPQYIGPRNYIKLVHCPVYGELKSIASREDKSSKRKAISNDNRIGHRTDSGTSQFWTLLAAASRGVNYMPKHVCDAGNRGKYTFASDVLKVGRLAVEDRLEAKLSILKRLQDRGIWLIDVSVIGWYISQPQQYQRSRKTNEIHRMSKDRPKKSLKAASMILSFELFTKHIIREAAEEGGLNLLVLIGKELENILSMERITDAVSLRGTTTGSSAAGSSAHCCKIESIPAPNAWSKFSFFNITVYF